MKSFVGVTDNDWFACGTLLKQVWAKAQGLRLKKSNLIGQSRIIKFLSMEDGDQLSTDERTRSNK
jgi:hypothetical protein